MKYSVIICAKNEESNVVDALTSINKLILPIDVEIEIILVDNGSTDMTVQLAKNVISELQIIKCERGGVAASRNEGIKAAQGEYIVFADCDAICDKNCLVEIHNSIISGSEPEVIQGNIWAQYYDAWTNKYLSRWRESVFKSLVVADDNYLTCFHGRLVAINRKFLKELSPPNGEAFNGNLLGAGGEDLECGKRAYKAGARIALAANAIIYHKDPQGFVSLLIKRYKCGVADVKAGMGQRIFDFNNFFRVVINPKKAGVPLWFSFSFWLCYITGCTIERMSLKAPR